ncbi:predicted protein [Streptomyces iranensis]|uniref:Uncharacterized protein n=1 Tax=Streptomyces iranensis TaxID=576784 RepID=A0A060ZTL1_9ACTN|nr:predicted protein [Streptomyces iranensis]
MASVAECMSPQAQAERGQLDYAAQAPTGAHECAHMGADPQPIDLTG